MKRLLLLLVLFPLSAFGTPATYSRSITIDYTKCGAAANSTDFPMLFAGTYTYLKTVANGGLVQNASGYDIQFTSDEAGTTLLSWEIERYIATTGEVVFWVKIPTLSYTANTVIYLWYGNSGISTFQGGSLGAAWNSSFQGVYHLPDGTTLTANDSTANANDYSGFSASPPTAAAGVADGAADFEVGSSQYIAIPEDTSLNIAGPYTISAWIKRESTGTTGMQYIFTNFYDSGGNYYGPTLGFCGTACGGTLTDKVRIFHGFGDSGFVAGYSAALTDTSSFHHVVGLSDGTNLKIYIDGTQSGSDQAESRNPGYSAGNQRVRIGDVFFGAAEIDLFDGIIDEVRVASGALSASTITAAYNNGSSPSTFYALGDQVGAAASGFMRRVVIWE